MFVGSAGTNNDITTLRLDRFITNLLNGAGEKTEPFLVNGELFKQNYYLVDGIYPSWTFFMKSLSAPVTRAEKRFVGAHEGNRKDVERLFGVVKQRFKMVRGGNRIEFRQKSFLCSIVSVCFILHNMIVLRGMHSADVEDEDELGELFGRLPAPARGPGDHDGIPWPGHEVAPVLVLTEIERRASVVALTDAMVQSNIALTDNVVYLKLRDQLIEAHGAKLYGWERI